MQPFPNAWSIVRPAIQDTLDNAKALWKLNLIGALGSYVLVPLVAAPVGFLAVMGFADTSIAKIGLAILLGLVLGVAALALAIWYGAHYTLQGLKIVRKEAGMIDPKASAQKVPGAVWVAILQALATGAIPLILLIITAGSSLLALLNTGFSESATAARGFNVGMGLVGVVGFFAAGIIAVYAGLRLQFSSLSFLDQGKRGVEALKASWKLTDGRFWKILGVLFVFFLVYLLASFVLGIIIGILGAIFGNGAIGSAITTLVNAVLTSFLFAPTAIFFSVRLYEAVHQLPALPAQTQTASS